jgi:hypothetical protein
MTSSVHEVRCRCRRPLVSMCRLAPCRDHPESGKEQHAARFSTTVSAIAVLGGASAAPRVVDETIAHAASGEVDQRDPKPITKPAKTSTYSSIASAFAENAHPRGSNPSVRTRSITPARPRLVEQQKNEARRPRDAASVLRPQCVHRDPVSAAAHDVLEDAARPRRQRCAPLRDVPSPMDT